MSPVFRRTTPGLTEKWSSSRRAGSDTFATETAPPELDAVLEVHPFPLGVVVVVVAAAATTAVGTVVAEFEPSAFFAVTRARSVFASSTVFSAYVFWSAPRSPRSSRRPCRSGATRT